MADFVVIHTISLNLRSNISHVVQHVFRMYPPTTAFIYDSDQSYGAYLSSFLCSQFDVNIAVLRTFHNSRDRSLCRVKKEIDRAKSYTCP